MAKEEILVQKSHQKAETQVSQEYVVRSYEGTAFPHWPSREHWLGLRDSLDASTIKLSDRLRIFTNKNMLGGKVSVLSVGT